MSSTARRNGDVPLPPNCRSWTGDVSPTVYLYDGDSLLEEMDLAGNVLARYTQTQRIDEQLAMLRSSTTSYYESDDLWSITSLSNGTGAVANTNTYDSFGNVTNSTGTLTNLFRFTDREFDIETNLQFSRHRYYDPSIGRFLGEDLIRFEEKNPNLYWYVANRPTNLVDPLGLFPGGGVPILPPLVGCNGIAEGAAAMWDNYERMKQRNWKGDDLYYHCMGNCQATNRPCGGSTAAAVISFFRTNVWGRATEDDWRDDDRANKCGQQGGDCNKTCAPFVPKSSPGKPPFPGW
jgi:RHS repeat-associated protein